MVRPLRIGEGGGEIKPLVVGPRKHTSEEDGILKLDGIWHKNIYFVCWVKDEVPRGVADDVAGRGRAQVVRQVQVSVTK